MDKDTNLVPPLLIAAFLVVAAGFVGGMDYEDALVVEAIRKDPPFPAHLVIPYSAVICQDSGTRKPVCKWYVAGTTKQEIRK